MGTRIYFWRKCPRLHSKLTGATRCEEPKYRDTIRTINNGANIDFAVCYHRHDEVISPKLIASTGLGTVIKLVGEIGCIVCVKYSSSVPALDGPHDSI